MKIPSQQKHSLKRKPQSMIFPQKQYGLAHSKSIIQRPSQIIYKNPITNQTHHHLPCNPQQFPPPPFLWNTKNQRYIKQPIKSTMSSNSNIQSQLYNFDHNIKYMPHLSYKMVQQYTPLRIKPMASQPITPPNIISNYVTHRQMNAVNERQQYYKTKQMNKKENKSIRMNRIQNENDNDAKISLKSIKKSRTKVPNIYISLKYQNIVSDYQYKDYDEYNGIHFKFNSTKNNYNNNQINSHTNAYNGCSCRPQCHFVNKWLSIIQSRLTKNNKQDHFHYIRNYKSLNTQIAPSEQASLPTRTPPSSPQSLLLPLPKSPYSIQSATSKSVFSRQSITKQIQLDIPRTYSNETQKHKGLTMREKQILYKMLCEYCLQSKIGYVQGMNLIGGVIVHHTGSQQVSIRIFRYIMQGYSRIYEENMEICRRISKKVIEGIKYISYDMYIHFRKNQLVQVMQTIIQSWLLSIMGNIIPLQYMHHILDSFITEDFNGIITIIIVIFIRYKSQVMSLEYENIIQFYSVQYMRNNLSYLGEKQWKEILFARKYVSEYCRKKNIQFWDVDDSLECQRLSDISTKHMKDNSLKSMPI